MKGIARQLAISETQLINKGMENMHIMCIVVGVMEETLYQDVHIASTVPACLLTIFGS
jgi:hypothetical protein